LLRKISVNQKQNESSVKELAQEGYSGNSFELGGLSGIADPGNSHNNDQTDEIIENSKYVLH